MAESAPTLSLQTVIAAAPGRVESIEPWWSRVVRRGSLPLVRSSSGLRRNQVAGRRAGQLRRTRWSWAGSRGVQVVAKFRGGPSFEQPVPAGVVAHQSPPAAGELPVPADCPWEAGA